MYNRRERLQFKGVERRQYPDSIAGGWVWLWRMVEFTFTSAESDSQWRATEWERVPGPASEKREPAPNVFFDQDEEEDRLFELGEREDGLDKGPTREISLDPVYITDDDISEEGQVTDESDLSIEDASSSSGEGEGLLVVDEWPSPVVPNISGQGVEQPSVHLAKFSVYCSYSSISLF